MKYVRDSREYETLTRQIYRMATEAVRGAASQVPAGQAWAAVLDVDETALDNSIYQLDRAAYGLPFENSSWNAWVRRGAAGLVPGVTGFVNAVRAAGGRIAWITNRDEEVRDATRENLLRYDLWRDDDRLCLATPDRTYNKAVRRKELQSGAGACAWSGIPATVIVFVGDQMGDFPLEAAAHPDEADAKFGKQFFLLPNPMYGTWSSQVTRH
jgi:5'-nucleotidase (lipoprotein e(P4) family)